MTPGRPIDIYKIPYIGLPYEVNLSNIKGTAARLASERVDKGTAAKLPQKLLNNKYSDQRVEIKS